MNKPPRHGKMILFFIAAFLFVIAGCSTNPPKATRYDALPGIHRIGIPVSGQARLKPFDAVVTNGFFTTQIDTGYPDYQIEIIGDKAIVEQVHVRVKSRTLFVDMPPDLKFFETGPVTVAIKMPRLNYLRYAGTGDVTVHSLQENKLTILSNGSGQMAITGDINLKRLDVSGVSNIHVQWVNSDKLVIRASNRSHIFLTGTADRLDAELADNASLDARYLRAKKVFINTAENASADVRAIDWLNALASGNSNIYYYQNPRLIIPYMRDQGSVLPMFHQRLAPCLDTLI